jgi:hypothetical protein
VVELEVMGFATALTRRGDVRTAVTISLEHGTPSRSGNVTPAPARRTPVGPRRVSYDRQFDALEVSCVLLLGSLRLSPVLLLSSLRLSPVLLLGSLRVSFIRARATPALITGARVLALGR